MDITSFFVSGFFNWTATYRDDSDLQRPYGWIDAIDAPLQYAPQWRENQNLWQSRPFDKGEFVETLPQRPQKFRDLAKKPKLVAWIVSNCRTNSNREDYVEKLKQYIKVRKNNL